MKSLSTKKFEKNLRKICDNRGVSIEDVLKYAGMSQYYHYRWKDGNNKVKGRLPNYKELAKMAEILKCNLGDLVYGRNSVVNIQRKKYVEMVEQINKAQPILEKYNEIKDIIGYEKEEVF